MDVNLSQLWEILKDRGACYAAVHGAAESWTVKKAECEEMMLLNCGVGDDS